MMIPKYLIRLDDACPTMNSYKWGRIEILLDNFNVKPMVGIVPDCKDEKLICQKPDQSFWEKAINWQEKGWAIALHGYDHCYISDKGMQGLNPMWKRSEFAGVPLELQREKICRGVAIMKDYGLQPQYFFAPSHTFDENTLMALREESDIRIISDTVGRYPYGHDDFYFIPQVGGHCVKMPFLGIFTFCLHPNLMNDTSFIALECFLNKYNQNFIGFDEIDLNKYGKKEVFDKFLSILYFKYRQIRGVR